MKTFRESIFLRVMCATLFILAHVCLMIVFLTFYTLLYFIIFFVIFHRFYVWFHDYFQLNLFIRDFASRIYIIINAYFFFSLFFANHFIFFIYNFECMISLIFFIIFAFSFLMFWNIFLTFILYIIISNFSRRKIVVETTFLT